jgi:hypothetical protein
VDADAVERRRMRRTRRNKCPFSKSLNFISISKPWEDDLLMDALDLFFDDLVNPIVSGLEDLSAEERYKLCSGLKY